MGELGILYVYVRLIGESRVTSSMIDYLYAGADVLLAVVSASGVYYAMKARRLFKGDFMQRTFELTAGGLSFLTLISVLDFTLQVTNPGFALPLVRIATLVAVGVILVAQVTLVRWASSPDGA